MFECRLNQFLVEILQQYNASLGLNNPPPTAQLLNAMASFIKQNTVKNIELSFDGANNELTAKATYNDNRFAETKVDLSSLKYELNVFELAEKLEGSESIVVDIDETNSKVEIHLDAELVSKIDRALLIPLFSPTEFELVGINDDGEQVRVKLGDGVEYDDLTQTIVVSGGGGMLYRHTAYFSECTVYPEDYVAECTVSYLSSNSEEELPTNGVQAIRKILDRPNFGWSEDYYGYNFTPYNFVDRGSVIYVSYADIDGNKQRVDFLPNTEMYHETVTPF